VAVTAFVSHSTHDAVAVQSLVEHLSAARESVWFDESLHGGEAWWTRILDQIRSCSVFVVALSNNVLRSKRCRAEMAYAEALGLPILPVLIGEVNSYRLDPIFTVQLVDYRNPDAAEGIRLIEAVRARVAERTALPDPLPENPPIPYEYLPRLGVAIGSPAELSPAVQESMLHELRRAMRDEDDAGIRSAIRELLLGLRNRPEVTHTTASDIDEQLSRTDPAGKDGASGGSSEEPGVSPQRHTSSESPRWWQRRRNVAVACGGAIVLAVVSVVGYLVIAPSPPTTPKVTPAVAVTALQGLLLSVAEITTATGATAIAVSDTLATMSDESGHVSDKACMVMSSPAEASVYAGSGWMGAVGQFLEEPHDQARDRHIVVQAVVAFPTARAAEAFFTSSAQLWPACGNRRYITTEAGKADVAWTVGDVANVDGTLSASNTPENENGWTCQRALTVRNNIAVDTQSCSEKVSDSGIDIARKIAHEIPAP
jgi:hypothetical protein